MKENITSGEATTISWLIDYWHSNTKNPILTKEFVEKIKRMSEQNDGSGSEGGKA